MLIEAEKPLGLLYMHAVSPWRRLGVSPPDVGSTDLALKESSPGDNTDGQRRAETVVQHHLSLPRLLFASNQPHKFMAFTAKNVVWGNALIGRGRLG